MGALYTPTVDNLRPLLGDTWTTPAGMLTDNGQKYFTNLGRVLTLIGGIRVSIVQGDSTAQVQSAIQKAIRQGGGVIILPAGVINMGSVSIPAGAPPITFVGQGWATVVLRNTNLAPGVGLFDVSGSVVTFLNFCIDGATTTPTELQYGVDFSSSINANDPMAPSLTNNTSVWVHGPATDINFGGMLFRHAAGYSILLDALTGDISTVSVMGCYLQNNRPTLFGTVPGQLIYGSWNGGIFAKSDGRAAMGPQSGVVSNFIVQGGSLQRGTGNQIWSHGYGFARLNSNFRYVDNQFLDCGLDGILVDCVSGGCVQGNVMRRIGYTTLTDTDQSTPRWLVGLNATGIDSGVVIGCPYNGNSLTSVNGGFLDLDGHGYSSLTSNVFRMPAPGDWDYDIDQIAICGPTNTGNGSYGYNMGNTYSYPQGATEVLIESSTMTNLPAGAVRLYSARNCKMIGCLINAPANSIYAPVQMGPQGTGPYQRCYSNVISHNTFNYSPGVASTPCVLEDNGVAFSGGEVNSVFGNNPIIGNGNAIEFQPSGSSGSPTYLETVWFT